MSKKIFWNRRSGKDRRSLADRSPYASQEDRRRSDRRLYGNNDYVLIIGQSGLDKFSLLVTVPTVVIVLATLVVSAAVNL